MLQSAIQFAGIDQRKEKLLARLQGNERARRKYEQKSRERVLEAYRLWLKPSSVVEKRILEALDAVDSAARNRSGLDIRLLSRVHALVNPASAQAESGLREDPGAAEFASHGPFPPELIAGALERSLEWFQSEGVLQLHPVERTVLSLARLAEIAPFPGPNLPGLVLATAYEMLAAGFPPPAFFASDRAMLHSAMQAAVRMETQALINLYVAVETQALEELERV